MKPLLHGRMLGALLLLLAAGCSQGDEGPRNVILIGVDTLRADHLGLYGYPRDTSPNLDRFAAGAVVFERCIVPVPRTTQAVATIMTGRHPVNTGVRTLLGDLDDDAITLAGVLGSHGYRTVRVVAARILQDRIERGFQKLIGTKGDQRAGPTTDAALEELRAREGPTFLWVFYHDPHMPYEPPEVVFDREYRGPHRKRIRFPRRRADLVFRNRLSPRTREHVVALYDSEIFYTDREIGRLLDWIDRHDPGALVIFTSDHGEGLGERGYYYDHGAYLNQASLRVPLVIRGLGLPPQRVRRVVRLVDVMPTVLGVLGLEVPQLELDGVDLRRVVASEAPDLEAFSETGFPIMDDAVKAGVLLDRTIDAKKRSIVSGDLKLVYVPRAEGVGYELYDLAADPEERHDLWGSRDVSELRAKLDAWVARDLELSERRAAQMRVETLSDEERDLLRTLGYLD
jgi:arylsulfatase A-like enzyme